jgi:DNA-binding winged helix-turn-helix (wHTH) protein
MKFVFGRFQVDEHQLLQDGAVVPVQPRPLCVLNYLLNNRHRVVTRDELLDEVWGSDVHVTPGAADAAIARLRRILGPTAEKATYILTFQRRGWRFVYPIDCE